MTKLTRPPLPSGFSSKHLFSIETVSQADLEYLLTLADYYASCLQTNTPVDPVLKGQTQINVFFENSTRTNSSFELAGKKLGANVIVVPIAASSVHKGEELQDTVQTLAAMGADSMVVRDKEPGTSTFIAEALAAAGMGDCAILNAGEGTTDHPSQALLDALTIFRALGRAPKDGLEGVTIAICGDIRHSRVASSNCQLLPRLGATVRLVGPRALMPDAKFHPDIERFETMEAGLKDADFVMALRIQFERLSAGLSPDLATFFVEHGLSFEKLGVCPTAKIMHPGPMNRGTEISGQLADDPAKSLILTQVRNGVPTRMALLDALTGARHKG